MSAAASLLRRASALLDYGAERAALLVDLGEALTHILSSSQYDHRNALHRIVSTATARQKTSKSCALTFG